MHDGLPGPFLKSSSNPTGELTEQGGRWRKPQLARYANFLLALCLPLVLLIASGCSGSGGSSGSSGNVVQRVAAGLGRNVAAGLRGSMAGPYQNPSSLPDSNLIGGYSFNNSYAASSSVAGSAVTEPSVIRSSPAPFFGMAQTVNLAQTMTQTGAFTAVGPEPVLTSLLMIDRQADCSFALDKMTGTGSATSGGLPSSFTTSSSPNFGAYMRALAGMPAQTGTFPLGCKGWQLGTASQNDVYVGQTSDGDQIFVDLNPLVGYEVRLVNLSTGATSSTPLPDWQSLGLTSLVFSVADVNGDGVNDLIAVEASASVATTKPGVYVFLGKPDGSFADPVYYAAGNNQQNSFPESVSIADVNGDGKLDLVVVDSGFPPDNVQVLLGNGDGTFQPAIASSSSSNAPGGGIAREAAIGDFNGDGKPDLVLSDGEILLGNGDGTFAPTSFTLPGIGGTNGASPVVGDFNNDGKLDIAMNMSNGNSATDAGLVAVFLGKGDGTFTTGPTYADIYGSGHISAEDLDGDGNLDLIIGSGDNGVYSVSDNTVQYFAGVQQYGAMQVLMGHGDGTFAGAPVFPGYGRVANPPTVPTFAVADFNGDGHPDVLTMEENSSGDVQGMVLLTGDGKGDFTPGAVMTNYIPFAIVAADMNGDGKPDAVYEGYSNPNNQICVALGNGNGTFQAAQCTSIPSITVVTNLVTGDFNGDGKTDVLVTGFDSSSGTSSVVDLLTGNGSGGLSAPVQIDTQPDIYGLAAGDFAGNGNLDFAITTLNNGSANTQGSVLVYMNNGNGSFAAPVSYAASMFPGPIVAADVNGDKKLDLIVGSQDGAASNPTSDPLAPHGSINVLLGNGDGTFAPAVSSPLNDANYTNLAVADINGDGIPDVIVGDNASLNPLGASQTYISYTQVLYGKGDGTFPTGNILLMGLNSESVTAADVNGDGRPDLLMVSGTKLPALSVFLNQFSGETAPTLAPTTTTLTVSPNPAVVGQSVTFTATVTAASGGTTPTGTVTFMNGSTQLGTSTLGANGTATYSTSSLAAGAYSVTAVYGGDTSDATSTSSATTLTVNAQAVPVATTTTLTASPTTITAGQSVTLTATVAGPTGSTAVPTGIVTFLNGSTTLGTGTLNGSGVATYTANSLGAGAYSITAQYGGSTGFAASTSSAVTVTVNAVVAPSFTLAAGSTTVSVTQGQSATVGLTVTPANGFNSAVTFSCSGLPSGAACSFSPATVTPNGTQAATTTMTITTAGTTSENRMVLPLGGGGIAFGFVLLFFGKRKRFPIVLCLILLIGGMGAMVGCGGSGHSKLSGGGTPPGSSTVTVTATSGSGASAITETATVGLTVQAASN